MEYRAARVGRLPDAPARRFHASLTTVVNPPYFGKLRQAFKSSKDISSPVMTNMTESISETSNALYSPSLMMAMRCIIDESEPARIYSLAWVGRRQMREDDVH